MSCSSGAPLARSSSGASASRSSTSSSLASRASSSPGAFDVNEAARATTPRASRAARRSSSQADADRSSAASDTSLARTMTRGGCRTSGSATASSASTCVSCRDSDENRPLRDLRDTSGCRRLDIQRWVLPKDRPLQLLERRARVDSKLDDESPARILVGVQRLGLPTRPVQRSHQIHPQVLAERVFGYECLDLSDELVLATECEVGVDPELDRRESDLLEPGDAPPARSSRRRSPLAPGPSTGTARRGAAPTRRPPGRERAGSSPRPPGVRSGGGRAHRLGPA